MLRRWHLAASVHLVWAQDWPATANGFNPGDVPAPPVNMQPQIPFQMPDAMAEPTALPTMPPEPSPAPVAPPMCQDFLKLRSQVTKSPVRTYVQNFGTWLRESPYQTAIALAAFAIGCVCAWDGPRLWENLLISGCSMAVAWLAHFESSKNDFAPNLPSELVLTLAAGGITGLAVYSGFEGTQVIIGAVIGFAAAANCGVGSQAQAIDKSLPGISLTWCCAGSIFGAWVLVTWRRPLLACLAPLFGSYLVVAGLGTLLGDCLDTEFLPLQGAPWSVEASILLGPLGLHALTWHCLCAFLAASLQNCGRRALAVVALIAYVVLLALGALLVGVQCHDGTRTDGSACPEHLAFPGRWQWQCAGCTAWAILAAYTGWRQLGALQVYLSRKLSRRTSRSRSSYAPLDEPPNVESGLQAFVPPGYTVTTVTGPQRLSGFVSSLPHRRPLGTV